MNIIETKNLCFSYGEGEILKGVSLSIAKGEFVAIVGRNGSGKSTLAKHFNAINLPVNGSVYVCGLDTADEKNVFEIRSRAGMVFQNPDNQMVAALVEDEVAFAPENLGIEPEEIRSRVDKALKTVRMSEYALHSTAALSGGQKQRVAIAAVLAMKPEILILDEATAMLDPKGRKEVMATVEQIKKSGATIVHITHYMEEAALADRVIVMDNGRIILDDTPQAVFKEEQVLKNAGLEVPQIVQLAYELKKDGIEAFAITEDEMYEKLCRIKNNDKI